MKLDVGPLIVAHLHGDAVESTRVRLSLQLDKSGAPVVFALPDPPTPNMQDDPQLREMTCDPKYRRVLITDGRNAVGQAMAKAFRGGGSVHPVVGIADPWKPFAGMEALRQDRRCGIVPLRCVQHEVGDRRQQNGGRIDILVNTAEHTRPADRSGGNG